MERKLKTSQRIYMWSDDEAARAVQQDGNLMCMNVRED